MKFISILLASLALFFGLISIAQADQLGLIPCGNVEAAGKVTDPCTYTDLVYLAQTVIKFMIFSLAAPIAAIMFAYAGFVYITNGGNEAKIKQAHDIFLMVFWGLVIALAAWLMINFILVFILGTGSVFNFLS